MLCDDLVIHVCKYTDGLYRNCTHNCVFCMENTDAQRSNYVLPSIEMIREVLEGVTQGLTRTLDNIHIAGGEPTLRSDLFDIVNMTSHAAKQVFISTHGDYDQPALLAQRLKTSGATNAAFSLHGADDCSHDQITGVEGSFGRTCRSIRDFIDEGLVVHINCVVTSLNVYRLKCIVELVAQKFPLMDQIIFTHYRRHGKACDHDHLYFDAVGSKTCVSEAIDLAFDKGVNIKFRDFPLCIDMRLPAINSKDERFFVVIWDGCGYRLVPESAHKTLKPSCKGCQEAACTGFVSLRSDTSSKYDAWMKI